MLVLLIIWLLHKVLITLLHVTQVFSFHVVGALFIQQLPEVVNFLKNIAWVEQAVAMCFSAD